MAGTLAYPENLHTFIENVTAQGLVRSRSDYYPFGSRMGTYAEAADANDRWRFSGKEWQEETTLNQKTVGIAHEFSHVLLFIMGRPFRHGDENADTYIENRSRLMSRRLGYDN